MIERTARPLAGLWHGLANVMGGFYRVLGTPGRWLQDFLNGVWLGHPVHAVVVDVVIGAYTAVVVLDLIALIFGARDLETATLIVLGLGLLSALGAIVTGLTDFKDTLLGDQQNVTGLHGYINIASTVIFAVAFVVRVAGDADLGRWLGFAAYLVISVGAYIGGHVVYKFGYMVDRNAYARGRRAKDWTPVMPAAELPDATPTKVSFGATALVVVRRGDVAYALRESCSHVGGPLSEGELQDDAIVCPWHFSTFGLADGRVRHGPATNRQPAYRARINAGQVEVLGPET